MEHLTSNDGNANNRSPRPSNLASQGDAAPAASSPDPFTLTTEQASRRYNASPRTLSNWRAAGMPFLLPGPRKVLFITRDADEWVRTRFSIGRPKPTLARIAASAGGAA
ncbi:MAG: hypothetical protein WCR07_04320 [Verrucomicrobiota bacterium]